MLDVLWNILLMILPIVILALIVFELIFYKKTGDKKELLLIISFGCLFLQSSTIYFVFNSFVESFVIFFKVLFAFLGYSLILVYIILKIKKYDLEVYNLFFNKSSQKYDLNSKKKLGSRIKKVVENKSNSKTKKEPKKAKINKNLNKKNSNKKVVSNKKSIKTSSKINKRSNKKK
jgi:hypothetical protein